MTQKPLILAVETSSRIGSVVLALDEKILAKTTFSAPLKHSAEIFPAIQKLLDQLNKKPMEIEHIYISAGPGSFTGLRIAVTIAKTMYLANRTKIVALDTLDVIAANVILPSPKSISQQLNNEPQIKSIEKIATILDAKRGHFFIAAYKHYPYKTAKTKLPDARYQIQDTKGIWKKFLPDSLMSPSQFLDKFVINETPIWLLGDGLLYHKEKFKSEDTYFFNKKYWSPRAEKVHLLGWQKAKAGQFAEPVALTPFYMLKPDIKIKPH